MVLQRIEEGTNDSVQPLTMIHISELMMQWSKRRTYITKHSYTTTVIGLSNAIRNNARRGNERVTYNIHNKLRRARLREIQQAVQQQGCKLRRIHSFILEAPYRQNAGYSIIEDRVLNNGLQGFVLGGPFCSGSNPRVPSTDNGGGLHCVDDFWKGFC